MSASVCELTHVHWGFIERLGEVLGLMQVGVAQRVGSGGGEALRARSVASLRLSCGVLR